MKRNPLINFMLLALGAIGLGITGCDRTPTKPVSARVFHVDDFGATPDGKQNSRQAILKAIAAAKSADGAAEVVFGPGTYRIETEFVKKDGFFLPHCITIDGARNLTIRGTGSRTRLLVTNPQNSLFWVTKSEGVSFEDVTVDYDPLPFSQGRITAVDAAAATLDVELEEGYADLDRPYFDATKSMLVMYDAQLHSDLPPSFEVLRAASKQPLGPRQWRLTSAGHWMKKFDPESREPDPINSPYVRVGAKVVFSARDGATIIGFSHCVDSAVRRITAHAGPGGFITALHGRNLRVADCIIAPPEGSTRLMSTCADGVHLKNLGGSLVIERNRFEKMGDDCINFHATGLFVEKALSPQELLLHGRGWRDMVAAGDTLQVIDQKTGPRGEATVTGLELQELPDGLRYRVSLDRPLEGVKSGTERDGDLVFNVNRCPSPFIVRDNHLSAQTEIIAKGINGVIENNNFVSTDTIKQAVVMAYAGFPWFEGPVSRDVTIRNNTFVGRRVGQIWLDSGVSNVKIMANRFRNIVSPMLRARGITDTLLQGNTIDNGPEVLRTGPYTCVSLDNVRGVVIDQLEVTDPSPLLSSVVSIGSQAAPGDSGVKISELQLNIAPTTRPLLDLRETTIAVPAP